MDGYAELRAFRATHPYQSLTVDGVEWKYVSGPAATEAAAAGVPEEAGPALLVLGGGFSFGDSAFRTITAFERRFRVISPSYPSVRTMAELLAGVAAILDAEGIRSASVFGHSLGAGVAHAFSRQYPQRVDKLVLSGFGLYTRGHTRLVGAFVRLFSVLPKAALARFYRPRIARLLAGAEDDERAFLSAYTEDLFAAHTRESALARLAVLLDLAAHPDRYATTSPFERPEDVLLIAASDDRGFTPREREALLAAYPGARTYVFGKGGHWAAATHPAEYADVVGRFLDGRPLSAGRGENPAVPPEHPFPERGRDDREPGPSVTLDARLGAFRASHRYRTLDVDGARWRYLAGGTGEQTVLLPSGGTRMPDMYLLLIEALERDFRVLAPAYPAGAGIAGLADGMAAILDAEGVAQADVLGSSFGGFVAQTFARRHPQHVRRLAREYRESRRGPAPFAPVPDPLPCRPSTKRCAFADRLEPAPLVCPGLSGRRGVLGQAAFGHPQPAGQGGSAVRPAGDARVRASPGLSGSGGAHVHDPADAGAADRIGAGRSVPTPGTCGSPRPLSRGGGPTLRRRGPRSDGNAVRGVHRCRAGIPAQTVARTAS
nr:alpha/beta hydrolase [Pseudarthrobacter sp. ATCC 49987]